MKWFLRIYGFIFACVSAMSLGRCVGNHNFSVDQFLVMFLEILITILLLWSSFNLRAKGEAKATDRKEVKILMRIVGGLFIFLGIVWLPGFFSTTNDLSLKFFVIVIVILFMIVPSILLMLAANKLKGKNTDYGVQQTETSEKNNIEETQNGNDNETQTDLNNMSIGSEKKSHLNALETDLQETSGLLEESPKESDYSRFMPMDSGEMSNELAESANSESDRAKNNEEITNSYCYCPNCGKKIDYEGQFCKYCGNSIN